MFLELLILFLTLSIIVHYLKLARHPPGPFSIPFLGTLDIVKGENNADSLVSSKYHKYGDLYSLYLGPSTIFVVINDLQLAKRLFSLDEFSGW